ncbi:hypothetical protein DFH09DRAFT_1313905 [Mycena vulgaris]|nr:hypothetical protein DFH09DRAFT_1313905 [Mycena vulgaris]
MLSGILFLESFGLTDSDVVPLMAIHHAGVFLLSTCAHSRLTHLETSASLFSRSELGLWAGPATLRAPPPPPWIMCSVRRAARDIRAATMRAAGTAARHPGRAPRRRCIEVRMQEARDGVRSGNGRRKYYPAVARGGSGAYGNAAFADGQGPRTTEASTDRG